MRLGDAHAAVRRARDTTDEKPLSCERAGAMIRRATPDEVAAVVGHLATGGAVVTVPLLVAALQRETGCSRATAYRAVSDAVAAGILSRKENAAS